MNGPLEAAWLGRRPYREMLGVQEDLVERRQGEAIPDTLLLLEHPPTYTLGRRSGASERTGLDPGPGTEVVETPRGGRITWHGPGQLVAYPIVDLTGIGDQPPESSRADVAAFVASLERAMVASLAEWGVEAHPIEGLTGIWTGAEGEPRKIGSIGLRVSRGVTSHGISINLYCDLGPFERIEACGIEDCRMTSVVHETGDSPSVEEAGTVFHSRLARELDLEPKRARSDATDSLTSP